MNIHYPDSCSSVICTLVPDLTFAPRNCFGLFQIYVYFIVLVTIWSKDRVISSIKSAQKVNFKPLKAWKKVGQPAKWNPFLYLVEHVYKFSVKIKKLYSLIKFWKINLFFVIPPEKLSIMANMLRKMYKSVNFLEVHEGQATGRILLKVY